MSRIDLDQGILSAKANCLPVVFLGIMGSIQISDPIVASLALVKATQSLGFSPGTQAIAASISTLALAATVVPMGVVADKIGRRRLIVLALLLTAIGDLVTAAAPDAGVFLVGRAVAGVGLGAVFAGAFGFVRSVVIPTQLSAALGIFAAWCSIPLFIFMPLGSAIADISWRITFLMIPVVAIVCAGLCFRILPDLEPLPPIKREYWGLAALAVGVVGMLIGISAAAKDLTSPSAVIPLAIGLLGLAAFAIIESKSGRAVFPMSLFKSPLFLVGALGGFAWNAAYAAAQLLSSNLWQYVSEFSALSASLRQLPIMVASIVASIFAGRIMGRGRSAVAVLVGGGILTAVGMALTGVFASSPNGLLFSFA
ncbi:MAG: MFS transporter, partial [Actinomycetes bacterium]